MSDLILDLTPGIKETTQYKAWQFPGGEIHFKLNTDFMKALHDSPARSPLHILARINTPSKFLFVCLMIDAIAKDYDNEIYLMIPYFPYQQADRDFAEGEPFALPTIIKMLATTRVKQVGVFDPHSDVTPALLHAAFPAVVVYDNSTFIQNVLSNIGTEVTLLSPDAGAYKKIFKLADKIGYLGSVESANKFRKHDTGEVFVRLSTDDFGGRDVLIVDDICMGGATFLALAQQVRERNVGRLYLAVSHGVFNNGFETLEAHFDGIFTTDSFRQRYDDAKKLTLLPF
jgi:ribose-phosphate pyrophosphokinase